VFLVDDLDVVESLSSRPVSRRPVGSLSSECRTAAWLLE